MTYPKRNWLLIAAELRNSFNYFLVVLAFVDNTFISITLLDYSFARGESGCSLLQRQPMVFKRDSPTRCSTSGFFIQQSPKDP
jgi:hypothetical protein